MIDYEISDQHILEMERSTDLQLTFKTEYS